MSRAFRRQQLVRAIRNYGFRRAIRNSKMLRMITINQGGRNHRAAWRTYIGILSGDIDPKEVSINA